MQSKNDAVSVRLSLADKKNIEMLVTAGHAMSGSDFIRSAIREKIERCGT